MKRRERWKSLKKNLGSDARNGAQRIPRLALNGLLMIANGFLLALIVCLFLFRPKEGKTAEVTLYDFKENSLQYYDAEESYRQINDNIDTYKASGRPD